MKILLSVSVICILSFFTNVNCSFMERLRDDINEEYFYNIPPPDDPMDDEYTTLPAPTPPSTTEPTTTIPSTEGPPGPPYDPHTTIPPPPPIPDEKSGDWYTIEKCQESMTECPWSIDELMNKIEETQGVDMSEFTGEGTSTVGPIVDPDSVDGNIVSGTASPGGTGGGSFPQQCVRCCYKYAATRKYKVDCIGYLRDTSLQWYYQRRKAMNGCFKCRNVCELRNEVKYL